MLLSRVAPALVIAVALHLWLKRRQRRRNNAALALTNIPGSLGSYFMGETLEFVEAMRSFEAERFKKYGDVFFTHVAGKNVVFVANQQLADFVYNAPESLIQAGTFDTFQALMKDSVLLMSGAAHRQARLQITKVLSDTQLDNNLAVLFQVFSSHLAQWRGPVDVHAGLKSAIFSAACRILFGQDSDAFEPIETTLRDLTKVYGKGFLALPIDLGSYSEFGRALLAKDQLMLFIRELAQRRRSQPDVYHRPDSKPDLLQLLLDAKGENGVEDDIDKVASNAQTILFGATDSTASLTAHALLQLSLNPAIRERVQRELESAFGPGPLRASSLNLKSMSKLPFLDAVLRECLRVKPPFASGTWRTAVADIPLPGSQGYVIPKGWMISVAMDWPHNHDDQSFPDPETFYPNRFLPTGAAYPSFDFTGALNPFGKGAHACPGKYFALAEAKLILGLVVTRPDKPFPILSDGKPPSKWVDQPTWEALGGMEMTF